MLRISSLNLNGIRAAYRKGFTNWIDDTDPDIICLQELRAMEHQVPDPIQELDYHGIYHTAEKKGYSGVGILSKEEPLKIQEGIGVDWIDNEGRIVIAEFENLYVFSIYAPSGTSGNIRQDLKMEFLDYFLPFAQKFLAKEKPLVMCGDYNICHKPIDIHNPKRNKNTSGFLPVEREWVTRLLQTGFEDVYRCLHEGEPDLYSWWSYRAASKKRNKGWRIDYHMTCPKMLDAAQQAMIEMEWNLSDHAPVTVDYKL